jgi:hypothetical protein
MTVNTVCYFKVKNRILDQENPIVTHPHGRLRTLSCRFENQDMKTKGRRTNSRPSAVTSFGIILKHNLMIPGPTSYIRMQHCCHQFIYIPNIKACSHKLVVVKVSTSPLMHGVYLANAVARLIALSPDLMIIKTQHNHSIIPALFCLWQAQQNVHIHFVECTPCQKMFQTKVTDLLLWQTNFVLRNIMSNWISNITGATKACYGSKLNFNNTF